MALVTTYTALQSAVSDWLARSDLTTFIPNFVQIWEEDFYREPKNFGRWMEVAADATISSSVVSVPSDYLQLKFSYVAGSPSSRLDRVSLNQLHGRYPRGMATGLPVWVAREASSFIFGPPPDSGYTVHLVYWGKPTPIRSSTNDGAAHYLMLNAPDVCLYGSLLAATPFIKDDARIPLWQAMYDRSVQSYRRLMRDEDTSGSPVQEVLA